MVCWSATCMYLRSFIPTMLPARVKTVVKCKLSALCQHPVLASDCHVVCHRCKLRLGSPICDKTTRCVECINCTKLDIQLFDIVVKLYKCGHDILKRHETCDHNCELLVDSIRQYASENLSPKPDECGDISPRTVDAEVS